MDNYNFDFFFNRIEYLKEKGKGFTLFNANLQIKDKFISKCEILKIPFKSIKISEINLININESNNDEIFIIYQDLSFIQFIFKVQELVDKIIYPLWYMKRTICFFSEIDESKYLINSIESSWIHSNYDRIIRFLTCEQMLKLLKKVNYQFSSPEFFNYSEDNIEYTPIELIMKDALESALLLYEPQVRIGRYIVDFLVTNQNKKIIVECDGRAYHTIERDSERDKALRIEGYPILHFTGSEIYNNVENCIEIIKQASKSKYNYIIDDDLDESQKRATGFVTGPIRVLAPAGSGKTKTLINRVVNLINQGIPQDNILALAFNKKAEEEMNTRLANKHINDVVVKTFHSFGNKIIREKLQWNFDKKTEKQKTRELLKDSIIINNIEIPHLRNKDSLDNFLDALSKTKMELTPIDEVPVESNNNNIPFEPIFNTYLELQKNHNFYNFDDMIYLSLRILIKDKIIREKYQSKYHFVLVDEFQDLNKAQLLLLQIISLPDNNVFIVGDDDQMIYGWRGAEVRHIIDFPKKYQINQDCTLSTNYRSSKKIVNHSKWLISNNKDRVSKDILPSGVAPIGFFDVELCSSLWEQAIKTVEWICNVKNEKNCNWKDFGVLFRLNAYKHLISIALDNKNIPHSPINLKHLYNTYVGKDIYSYLTIILYPNEATKEDFKTILLRPNKYLTNEFINSIIDWSTFLNSRNSNYFTNAQQQINFDVLLHKLKELQNIILLPTTSASSIVNTLGIEIGLNKFYGEQSKFTKELDDASDEIIYDVIKSVSEKINNIKEFYLHIKDAIKNEIIEDDQVDGGIIDEVVLTSIHKTKGNEYQNVVYFNLSKDSRLTNTVEIEEERRVTYVGITRAKENILITTLKNNLSIFLKEASLNPEYNTLSEDEMNKQINLNKMQIAKFQSQIDDLKLKINKINQNYPELNGDYSNRSYSLVFKPVNWIRDKKIKFAYNKIESLEEDIHQIKQKNLQPYLEKNSSLESDIKFREKLA